MRIGIDGRTMLNTRGGEGAGIGHYTFLLTKNLLKIDRENEYVLFLDKQVSGRIKQDVIKDHPNVSIRSFPFQNARKALPFVYSHMVMTAAFERAKLDVLHAPANSLPLFYRKPSVITVHDLAIYDHPEWFPSPYPNSLGFSERIVVPYSVRLARRIIAVSGQTKKDIQRVFGLTEDKIRVIHEGAGAPRGRDPQAVMETYGVRPKGYFLFLGTLEPRKNIPMAIRSYVEFVKSMPDGKCPHRLLLAGRQGWKYRPIMEAIEQANQELAQVCGDDTPLDRIQHLGYINREDKEGLISQALAFVFPSHYEGFGLPVIEAMSLGTPVIASNRASLPEICGNACVLVDPADQPAMTSAMRRAADDEAWAMEMGERGKAQAAKFSWRKAAAETLEVYNEAAEAPAPQLDDGNMPLDSII